MTIFFVAVVYIIEITRLVFFLMLKLEIRVSLKKKKKVKVGGQFEMEEIFSFKSQCSEIYLLNC